MATRTYRTRLLRLALGAVIATAAPCGCSSAYDTAFVDVTRPDDERLRSRVDELLQCADHTLRSLEEASSLYKREPEDGAQRAKLEARLNAAEAGAFQLQRRGLSVQDAARKLGIDAAPLTVSTLNTLTACRSSVETGVNAMRSASTRSPDQLVGAARRNMATLRTYAEQLADSVTAPPTP